MNKIDTGSVIKILKEYYNFYEKPVSERYDVPFKILVSCLLSLRTTDKNTEKASKNLFSVADTPEKIVRLSMKELERLIYSSGFYRNKAKVIKNVSEVILENYSGKVPDDFNELIKIKGIGRKTANIVLSYGFGKDAIAVDTHVHRIPNRIGWIKTRNPEETEVELMKIIDRKYWQQVNSLLVLHGQNICRPLSPKCSICPIEKYCKKIGVKKVR
jgi:endonuclease-3